MPRSLRSALDALTTDAARTYERAFTAEEAGDLDLCADLLRAADRIVDRAEAMAAAAGFSL